MRRLYLRGATRSVGKLLSLLILTVSSPAWGLTIDDFEDGGLTLSATQPSPTPPPLIQTGLDPNHVLGGGREVHFGLAPGSFDDTAQLEVTPTGADDSAVLLLTTNSAGPLATAGVDIFYGSLANPLNLDLLADGADRFRFEVPFLEGSFNGWGFAVRVFSGGVEANTGGGNILPGIVDHEFSLLDGTGVDLTSVDMLQVSWLILADTPGDLRLDLAKVSTVPEPSAGLLLGLGIAGVAVMRRRLPE